MANDSLFRKAFRSAEAQRNGKATSVLSQLRVTRPTTEYAAIFRAFYTAAPKTFRALCGRGPNSTSELVYRREALVPLSFERELLWASYWLPPQIKTLNEFRRCANEVELHVIDGNYQTAQSLVDEYVRVAGWSLWAVELRAALIRMSNGTVAQREWLAELQAKAVNSIPGLLFEIIGDRNDDAYSYDAVYAKCLNSFPRFHTLAPWLVDYLNFRAVAHIKDPASAFPNILCRDITSSLIDYYEDIIEALMYVETDSSSPELYFSAAQLISSLIKAGTDDYRILKLAFAFGVSKIEDLDIKLRPEEKYRSVYLGGFESPGALIPAGVASDLRDAQNNGAADYEKVGKLLKWGVNLRGVGIGPAVALAAIRSTSDVRGDRALHLNTLVVSSDYCIEDAAALSPEKAQQVIWKYLQDSGVKIEREQLLKPSQWNIQAVLPYGGPVYLWLGKQLLENEDYSELAYLTSILQGITPYWNRQVAKFNIQVDLRRRQLESAILELERWYRRNSFYVVEFPAEALFSGKKWLDFKNFDAIVVGLVAHNEYVARGNTNVHYICKMACRSFLESGHRDQISDEFSVSDQERQEQIIAFLRDVWVEENLSLCHQFETTADVRDERMSVLQLLLSWDSKDAPSYAGAIKDLTFDQTLQRGLQRIDQTRVFVNESAITRWAEKELEQDYERWRGATESSAGGRAVDDMLRQYALDPTNLELLKEFTDGKPTAADALLIGLIDRLYKRFLLDPTDGLDTYLSVRIRHGSLRGTILGPLEEQNLLYSKSGFSEEAFESRWRNVIQLDLSEKSQLIKLMQDFSADVREAVDRFVEQYVQIQSEDKPHGAFRQVLSPAFAKLVGASLAERPISFHAFLCVGYYSFWTLVDFGLTELRKRVSEDLAGLLHARIDRLISDLRGLGAGCLSLVTTLTTVSTMTKSQCDAVSDWFRLPNNVSSETYQLPDAIEIASVATKNVYRAFAAEIKIMSLPAVPLPLTTSGLAVLADCLFVVFENSWKHSGLLGELSKVDVHTEYDPSTKLLTLVCRNSLSPMRRKALNRPGTSRHPYAS